MTDLFTSYLEQSASYFSKAVEATSRVLELSSHQGLTDRSLSKEIEGSLKVVEDLITNSEDRYNNFCTILPYARPAHHIRPSGDTEIKKRDPAEGEALLAGEFVDEFEELVRTMRDKLGKSPTPESPSSRPEKLVEMAQKVYIAEKRALITLARCLKVILRRKDKPKV